MRYGSLFSGIGGFDLGFDRAGMECAWQVEIDPFCQKVLRKHWPNVTRYSDVREVGKHNLEPVDVICGGFPCQDVSLAGKRAGLEGHRSTLWGEYARIIRELRPKWVVAENVPGLFSSDDGQFFGNILRDLAEIGYDAEWQVLSAAAFGAPHRRERVIIVGHSVSCRCPPESIEPKRAILGEGTETFTNSDIQQDICNSTSKRLPNGSIFKVGESRALQKPKRSDWWTVEPELGRVANGVPDRVDRLRAIGNAVVPQAAEWIGLQLVAVDNASRQRAGQGGGQ